MQVCISKQTNSMLSIKYWWASQYLTAQLWTENSGSHFLINFCPFFFVDDIKYVFLFQHKQSWPHHLLRRVNLVNGSYRAWSFTTVFLTLKGTFIGCSVQDIDGSYFESFTALAWKQENLRQSVLKAAESASTGPPPHEAELGISPIDYSMPQNEKDKLYVEMLYTIANTVRYFRWNSKFI